MRALTCHGRNDVRVDTVPDPTITDPDDVVVKVTSSGLCGSDLHLYEVMGPFLSEGDILGDFATHHVALEDAPDAYSMFQRKHDGAVKVLFRPEVTTP